MKKLLIFSFALFSLHALVAQSLIAVQHEGQSSFFTELQPALDAAVDGDTVYLPGGILPGFNLTKSISLIGVGHQPDSTIATGRTVISSLEIETGSSGSYISGILFSGPVSIIGNSSDLVISRCYLNQGLLWSNSGKFCQLSENVFGQIPTPPGIFSIYTTNAFNNGIISNNVFIGVVGSVQFSEISNNIFLNNTSVMAYQSVFKNNVFTYNIEANTSSCYWYNNLNAGINGLNTTTNNVGLNNYLNLLPLGIIFTDFNSPLSFYGNDFHVVSTNYVGYDSTPVGIYGGLYPWKAGGVPYNPHIQTKTIAPTTNAQSNLNVQIRVAAQDH